MTIIGRHINGITLNPLEYVLDDRGEVMEFNSENEAKSWLRGMGITDDEIYWLVFEEIDAAGDGCDRGY